METDVIRFIPTTETNGTCLQGYADITYDELCDIFGEPHHKDPGDDKVQYWWGILFEDGTTATIYDYKNQYKDPWSIKHWHIGGYSDKSFRCLVNMKQVIPGGRVKAFQI